MDKLTQEFETVFKKAQEINPDYTHSAMSGMFSACFEHLPELYKQTALAQLKITLETLQGR